MLQRDTHAAMTQWKGTVNVNDTGYIPDINRVLDAHLYSQRLKGQSVVLTFSAPLELISPPTRLWNCYCNWDASWTGPSTTQEVCILNGVSMRFGVAWPFSDGLDVKYLPLRVKRKGASAVFLSSMGALLNGGVGERRAAVSRTLSLSNVGQNCDKVSSHFSTLKSKKLFVFVFLYKNRSLCANSVGTE